MLVNTNRPRRAFMNIVIAWAGDVIDALAPIVSIDRPKLYHDGEQCFPSESTGLAGDDNPTVSRSVSWAGGRDVALRWKLPSTGP